MLLNNKQRKQLHELCQIKAAKVAFHNTGRVKFDNGHKFSRVVRITYRDADDGELYEANIGLTKSMIKAAGLRQKIVDTVCRFVLDTAADVSEVSLEKFMFNKAQLEVQEQADLLDNKIIEETK